MKSTLITSHRTTQGRHRLWRFCLYPLTLLATTPVRLAQTLWASRGLVGGKAWADHPNFQVHKGINYLFYWTAAVNLHRFGRSGRSPYLGLGDYPLARHFHYSLLSLYAFWRAGAVTMVLGMFAWWLMHLPWLVTNPTAVGAAAAVLAVIGTTFYANAFGHQNYNVVGWAVFPAFLFGLLTHSWWIAGAALFVAAFGSITVVFLGLILLAVVAGTETSITPLLAGVPAACKIATHLVPLVLAGNIKGALLDILKAVGVTNRAVRYGRRRFSRIGKPELYFLVIYGQFATVSWLVSGAAQPVLVTAFTIFVLNTAIMRFADRQSMQMLMLSVATASMLQEPSWWRLPSYWLLASPLPLYVRFPSMPNVFDVVPRLAPYDVRPLVRAMQDFLRPVQAGQRVLMAFDDPRGSYERIFDGYRVLLELPLYVAAERGIHFMPDWWAVFESNYRGGPEFWGREVPQVLENARRWHADYVVVYGPTGTAPSAEWREAGFAPVTRFSWAEHEDQLHRVRPYRGPPPDWWLLRTGAGE